MNEVDARVLAEAQRKRAAWVEIQPLFAHLRARLSERLFASNIDQERLREKLFLAVQTLNSVEKAIDDTIKGAEHAQQIAEHFDAMAALDAAIANEGLTRP